MLFPCSICNKFTYKHVMEIKLHEMWNMYLFLPWGLSDGIIYRIVKTFLTIYNLHSVSFSGFYFFYFYFDSLLDRHSCVNLCHRVLSSMLFSVLLNMSLFNLLALTSDDFISLRRLWLDLPDFKPCSFLIWMRDNWSFPDYKNLIINFLHLISA